MSDEAGTPAGAAEGAVAPPPYVIDRPDRLRLPFVFNSPHSGSYYPPAFLAASSLDRQAIRRSEDLLVDRLFACAVALGAPLLRAVYPRAYVDVNREPYELDPTMFAGCLPPFANSRSLRVAGGLGTIPRLVGETASIYKAPLAVEEALARIDGIYRPYHAALRQLLADAHRSFGRAVLVDCHSMPSNLRGGYGRSRPDFVLGDRFGTSCAAEIVDRAAAALRDLGYTVSRNKPYAGGFITEHYGRPERGLHALQIEVSRGLYMDETRLEPHAGFARLQRDIEQLVRVLVGSGWRQDLPDAAE